MTNDYYNELVSAQTWSNCLMCLKY